MPHRRTIALAYQIALPHQQRITRGILTYARSQRTWDFAFSPEASVVRLDSLADWKGDGVLAMIETSEQLDQARRLSVPVVNFSAALAETNLPLVESDNREIGRVAALHLLPKGFQRFGFYGLAEVHYSQERLAGFEETLAAAGRSSETLLTTSSLHAPKAWMWNRLELERWLLTLRPPVAVWLRMTIELEW